MSVISAANFVVLELVGGVNGGYGASKLEWVRNLDDGNGDGGPGGVGWRVPAGQALLITGVDWSYNHPQGASAAGTRQIFRLFLQNLADESLARRVYESSILLGSQGEGGIGEALNIGFILSSKARLGPDVFPGPVGPPYGINHAIVRGYLIPDT